MKRLLLLLTIALSGCGTKQQFQCPQDTLVIDTDGGRAELDAACMHCLDAGFGQCPEDGPRVTCIHVCY